MEVKITFNDGTVMTAEQNGSCFIMNEKPELPEDLTNITIEGEDYRDIADARLIECASADGRYWFSFEEIPESEKEAEQLRADVDYLLEITE